MQGGRQVPMAVGDQVLDGKEEVLRRRKQPAQALSACQTQWAATSGHKAAAAWTKQADESLVKVPVRLCFFVNERLRARFSLRGKNTSSDKQQAMAC